MEWVSGVKLTRLQPEQLRKLSDIGQAAFLTQLLDFGFFHGDPHPGNLLVVRPPYSNTPTGSRHSARGGKGRMLNPCTMS